MPAMGGGIRDRRGGLRGIALVGSPALGFVACLGAHFSNFSADFAHNHGFFHAHPARQLVNIDLSHDVTGDNGDAAHYVANHFCTLHGITCHAFHQQVGLEAHEVGLIFLDVGSKLFGGVRLCETIGVFSFGKKQDFDVQPLGEQHIDTA